MSRRQTSRVVPGAPTISRRRDRATAAHLAHNQKGVLDSTSSPATIPPKDDITMVYALKLLKVLLWKLGIIKATPDEMEFFLALISADEIYYARKFT